MLMDKRFIAAVERAVATGDESMAAAHRGPSGSKRGAEALHGHNSFSAEGHIRAAADV
jgi:hypothetical protein